MPKVISIHSYRGGTGKSNITANLAAAVAMQGNRVGIVDTDVPSPGIHNIFGLEPEDIQQTLNSYLWGECEIEATAYDVSANIGLNNGKLFLVPSSVKADNIARILKDGYDVKLLNDGLRKFVKALALDYLFVDTHPGLSKETFLTIAICHILLLILRPDKQDYQGTAVAIATADLIKGANSTERLKRVLDMFRRYTGREHDIHVPVFLSEKATGNRNRAIAYLMLNFGMVSDKIDETLDLYFQQCSILVNARDLAMMAATLANAGINPITGERAIEERYVQDVISVMLTCGMYDYSGEWIYRVGMPAKSGVGGGITAVVPRQLGIGTFSPPLDEKGNSVRGIEVCKDLSRDFGLHLFNFARPERILKDWLEGSETVDGW